MPQPTTRSKTRKRQAQRRRPKREEQRAIGAKVNRSAKQLRRNAGRSRVPEMPEEQLKQRIGGGELGAVAVYPTGTEHHPVRRKMARPARSRAKSPSVGRQKQGRTAKVHRAQSGRADLRVGFGRK